MRLWNRSDCNFQVKGCLVEFSYIFAGTVLVSNTCGQYDLAFSVICEIKGRLPGIAFANLIYLYSLGLTCFWCSGQSEVGNAGAIPEIPAVAFTLPLCGRITSAPFPTVTLGRAVAVFICKPA